MREVVCPSCSKGVGMVMMEFQMVDGSVHAGLGICNLPSTINIYESEYKQRMKQKPEG